MIRNVEVNPTDDGKAMSAVYSNSTLVVNDYVRMFRPGGYGLEKSIYIPTLSFIRVHSNRPLRYTCNEQTGHQLTPTDEKFKDDVEYKDSVTFFLAPGEATNRVKGSKQTTEIKHFPRAFLRYDNKRQFASLVRISEPAKRITFNPSFLATVAQIKGEQMGQHLRQFLEFPREIRLAEAGNNSLVGRFDFYGGGNPDAYTGQYENIFRVYQKEMDFLETRFGVPILRNHARFVSCPQG